MGKTGTPWDVGWNRLLNGDSTPAPAAASAAARGGDFLVAARGWGRLCAGDCFGSISGDGWKGGGGELLRARAREAVVVGGGEERRGV
jgi:hypothetical protein